MRPPSGQGHAWGKGWSPCCLLRAPDDLPLPRPELLTSAPKPFEPLTYAAPPPPRLPLPPRLPRPCIAHLSSEPLMRDLAIAADSTSYARSLQARVHAPGRLVTGGMMTATCGPEEVPRACILCAAGSTLPQMRARDAHLISVAIAGLLPVNGHGRAGAASAPACPAAAPAVRLLCIGGRPGVGPVLVVVLRAAVGSGARCKAVLIARGRIDFGPASASGAPTTPPPPAPPSTCQKSLRSTLTA